MDTKALRQKILDLAIRGKLVPQDPNDEPASVLLERIREEKKQMVKEGKLKPKDIKNDTIIFKGEDNLHYEKFQDGTVKCIEDEIPFEVPDGWEWSRITGLCTKITDGTHHSPDNFPKGDYMYVTAKNIKENGIVLDDITYVTKDVHEEIYSRCNPEKGDILYIKDGATSGIATINDIDEEFSLLSSVALLKPSRLTNNKYLCSIMQSPYFYATTRGDMKGVGITRITLTMINSRLIPVAPLEEQVRITKYLQQTLPVVSMLENNTQEVLDLISLAKSKILDLAIKGNLVSQNTNDEPASVLLERIRIEKEALIKQGKLKRDKKESIIYKGDDNSYYEKFHDGTVKCIEDEIPFKIPETWRWCRLQELLIVSSSKRVLKTDWRRAGIPFYRAREIVKLSEQGTVDNELFITPEHYESLKNEYGVPEHGDIMLSAVGTIGKAYIVKENDVFYYKDASVICLHKISSEIDSTYVKFAIESPYMQKLMHDCSNGTTVDTITISTANQYLFPLPPLNEQQKIINCVNEIKNSTELIEANLI